MSVNWTKFSQSELVSIAFCNSSSFIKGAVTTLIIALVTGIAIAAFNVVIFDFWSATVNSPPNFSALSNTEASSGKSTGWTKNLSRIHWFDLLLEICANLISLFVISTPTISSPWTAFFPSLAFNKFSIFCFKLFVLDVETFGAESFLPKLGFLNLIFLNFSTILKEDFVSEVSLFSTGATTLCETAAGVVSLDVSVTGDVVCSGGIDDSVGAVGAGGAGAADPAAGAAGVFAVAAGLGGVAPPLFSFLVFFLD